MNSLILIYFTFLLSIKGKCLSEFLLKGLGFTKILPEPIIHKEQNICGSLFQKQGERLCVDFEDLKTVLTKNKEKTE